MAESVTFLAIDLAEIESAMLGESSLFDAALDVIGRDVTDATAARLVDALRRGQPLPWDREPLRSEGWEVFAQLSSYVASAWRFSGTPVGFDAWPDGQRLQFVLADWYPLPRGFGELLGSRPSAAVAFETPPRDELERWAPFVESYPHAYLTAAEVEDALPGLHQVICDLHARLGLGGGDGDPSPLDAIAPGHEIPANGWVDLTVLDDGSLEGWQLQRAAALYDACCRAFRLGKDLALVGY
jgi:hypothetical protein